MFEMSNLHFREVRHLFVNQLHLLLVTLSLDVIHVDCKVTSVTRSSVEFIMQKNRAG